MNRLEQNAKHSGRFHEPLHERDSANATYGCRHSNPDICKNHSLEGKCAFVKEDYICLVPPSTWKRQFERLQSKSKEKKVSEMGTARLAAKALIVDCEHKTAPLVDSGDIYSIRTADLLNGRIDFYSANRVSESTYREWIKREAPVEGDIILAREAPVGEVGHIPKNKRVCLGQRTVLIRAHDGEVDSRYLCYLLASPEVKADLISRSTGSVVEHLNVEDIRNFEIAYPPLPEQRAIAGVLSSLDDKIDLLHRQNKTLEGMAEALWRKMFVDEADPGWKKGKLGDYGQIICGKTPSKKVAEYFGGHIPFIKIPDMHGNIFIFETEDSLTEAGKKSQQNKTIPTKSICVSCIATVGLVGMNAVDSQTNQQINTIIPNKEFQRYFLFLLMRNMTDDLFARASGGTATDNLNTSDFLRIEISTPPENIIQKFDNLVKDFFEKIYINSIQISTLSSIRDTLLPKLMSGEVRVKL